jgi:hypothetical protein
MSGKLRTLVWKTGVLTIRQRPLNKSMHISWTCGRQDGVLKFLENAQPRRTFSVPKQDIGLLGQQQ